MEKNYVIIGNGTAAAGCIEGIRSVDKDTPITVISKETWPVYCRPLISYYLEGKAHVERMNYRPADFYEKNGCRVLYGVTAEKIDAENKTVTVSTGEALPYSSLCIASGSSPFVPPFTGLETVSVKFPFLTLDDALALEKVLTPEARVLIVGAGLIGLKCAEGIAERVGHITVCDLADRVLSSIFDNDCAKMMQDKLEEHGMEFLLSDTVTEFKGNTAVMKSGKKIDFDILVLAIGVRANSGIAKEAGAEVNRGIVVDHGMRTTAAGIYSAGDCAEGPDMSIGKNRVLAILPNAYIQGRTAGINMAGGEAVFDNAIPMNAIGFYGLHSMSAGTSFPESEGGAVYEERSEGTMKRLFTKDGLLTGFMLIGNVDRAGIYTAMIRNRVPLDSVDFEKLKKEPALAAFSKDYRVKVLGGEV